MRHIRQLGMTVAIALLPWSAGADLASAPEWGVNGAFTNWHYRVPLTPTSTDTANAVLVAEVDFAAQLASMGVTGTLDVTSVRVLTPAGVLLPTQEWVDTEYGGTTDPAGNGRGTLRFVSTGAGSYWLLFDTTANGSKGASGATLLNGGFEADAAGQGQPAGWSRSANSGYDAQVRPSESVSVTTNGSTTGNGSPPITTDGTPHTGSRSYLMGARSSDEPSSANSGSPAVTLSRTIAVPASNAGDLVFRYRLGGWDSSDDGESNWDFFSAAVRVGASRTPLVGPDAGNYNNLPFAPNKGTSAASNTRSGYGQFNGWDTDARGRHRDGMSLDPGTAPWFEVRRPLAAWAGQTITIEFASHHSSLYRSWTHIDSVRWAERPVQVGLAQAFGANVIAPNDTTSSSASHYTVGQRLVLRVRADAPANVVRADLVNPSGATVLSNIVLYDDGSHGDATAGDRIWSNDGSVAAAPTYTFGSSDQAGQWSVVARAHDFHGSSGTAGLARRPGQPAAPINQINYYNVDSQIFSLAASTLVNGHVYRDDDANGAKSSAEGGVPGSFVKAIAGGTVVGTAAADPVTGAFSLALPGAGAYEIIVDSNSFLTDMTPDAPAGYVLTMPHDGRRLITLAAGSAVPAIAFGLYEGSRVDVLAFEDNGSGVNDGVRQAGEAGQGALVVNVHAGATLVTSAVTGSDGAARLYIPATYAGQAVQVEPARGSSGWIATGGSGGTSGGIYSRSPERVLWSLTSGQVITGVAFGAVRPLTFAAPGSQVAGPGQTVRFAHRVRVPSGGSLILTASIAGSPATPHWLVRLVADPDCDGQIGPSEGTTWAGPAILGTGAEVCVIATTTVPQGLQSGAASTIVIDAAYTLANTSGLIVQMATLSDTVRVSDDESIEPGLRLVKSVRNVSTDSAWGATSSASPGEVVEYRIEYVAIGPEVLTVIDLRDAVPAYTAYVSGACGATPATATCALLQAPVSGADGALHWRIYGQVPVTSTGTVTYRVLIQ